MHVDRRAALPEALTEAASGRRLCRVMSTLKTFTRLLVFTAGLTVAAPVFACGGDDDGKKDDKKDEKNPSVLVSSQSGPACGGDKHGDDDKKDDKKGDDKA